MILWLGGILSACLRYFKAYCKNTKILSPDQILSRCILVLQSCNEGNFEHSCPSFKGQTPYVEFLKTFSVKKRQTKLIGYGFSFFLIYRRPSFDVIFFLINWRLMKNIRLKIRKLLNQVYFRPVIFDVKNMRRVFFRRIQHSSRSTLRSLIHK